MAFFNAVVLNTFGNVTHVWNNLFRINIQFCLIQIQYVVYESVWNQNKAFFLFQTMTKRKKFDFKLIVDNVTWLAKGCLPITRSLEKKRKNTATFSSSGSRFPLELESKHSPLGTFVWTQANSLSLVSFYSIMTVYVYTKDTNVFLNKQNPMVHTYFFS